MSRDPVQEHLAKAGRKGGQARSDQKKESAKLNCAKARAAKALYRMNPGLKPEGGSDARQ
jgi:hypothetical protein